MIDRIIEPNFASFREAARPLLAEHVSPSEVRFLERGAAQMGLPLGSGTIESKGTLRLSRKFIELAEKASCACAPDVWDLLYRFAYRLTHGEPDLLELRLDRDNARLFELARMVSHEIHHLHAFVRFRRSGDRMVAFIEPAHRVLRLALPFFVARFGREPFTLATKEETAHYDGSTLSFGPGIRAGTAPPDQEIEALFADYYAAAFNPARANRRLVDQKLPRRFRPGMPEVGALDRLLADAPGQVEAMTDVSIDMSRIPALRALPVLREAAASCDGCAIHTHATQTVFGEGPLDARIMLVGEQPGDSEDRLGRPFVGPAGKLLDEVLEELAIDRSALYVTNAVKHFKWEPRGKQRMHRSPKPNEIVACRPRLEAEIEALSPHTIVALGAVAGSSFFGPSFRLHKARGRLFETRWAERMLATHHPAAILRMADRDVQRAMREELRDDLRLAIAGRAIQGRQGL